MFVVCSFEFHKSHDVGNTLRKFVGGEQGGANETGQTQQLLISWAKHPPHKSANDAAGRLPEVAGVSSESDA